MGTIGIILLVLALYAGFLILLMRFGRFIHQCDDQIHEMIIPSKASHHSRPVRRRRNLAPRRRAVRNLRTSASTY